MEITSKQLRREWTASNSPYLRKSIQDPEFFSLQVRITQRWGRTFFRGHILIQVRFEKDRCMILTNKKTDDIYVCPMIANAQVITQLTNLAINGEGPLKLFLDPNTSAENMNDIPPQDIIQLTCKCVKNF